MFTWECVITEGAQKSRGTPGAKNVWPASVKNDQCSEEKTKKSM